MRSELFRLLDLVDTNDMRYVLDKLEQIVQGVEEDSLPLTRKCYGLCHNANLYLLHDAKHYLFESWDGWSGSYEYPVPDPYEDEEDSSGYAYETGAAEHGMYSGRYGALRLELATFIIQELEEYLEAYNERSSSPSRGQ